MGLSTDRIIEIMMRDLERSILHTDENTNLALGTNELNLGAMIREGSVNLEPDEFPAIQVDVLNADTGVIRSITGVRALRILEYIYTRIHPDYVSRIPRRD